MATNPMQRQARVSFLLGVVFMLLIAAAVVAFLFMQINKLKKEIEQNKQSVRSVYVLNEDVKSGQILTSDMFVKKDVSVTAIPDGATNDVASMLADYSLCDKDGRNIYVEMKDNKRSYYMKIDNKKVDVTEETDEDTGKMVYYVTNNSNKQYLELGQKTVLAKVALKQNTVITGSMVARGNLEAADVREMEYNIFSIPTDITENDYVDVRFMLPNGQDFIVVSKKSVKIPVVNGAYSTDTVKLNMSEDEILSLSSAIVEAWRMKGGKLHLVKYVEAGTQKAATPTYPVNKEVALLIESDPNVLTEALNGLRSRYNADMRNEYINSALSTYSEQDPNETYKTKTEESLKTTQKSRQEYLQSIVPSTY